MSMSIRQIIIPLLALILCLYDVHAATLTFSGQIKDSDNNEPIELAIIKLNASAWAMTDEHGRFAISGLRPGSYKYQVSYLGYENQEGEISLTDKDIHGYVIKLIPSSLALSEVVVTAQESELGSTSKIGQSAIQHLQAKSVEDMLQLLPGAVTKNPDLSNAGQAAIREIDADGNANNALGTAIIVDGITLSNDGNMQVFSTAKSGNNSSHQANTLNDQSTAGRGTDLRQISPDNIESIEVIRGIPSAEYGNLTSGAVIINTKVGVTPWEALAKVDPNSKLFYVGKGMKLKEGAINFSIDYSKSNSDRRRSYLSYDRITANAAYSTAFMQSTTPLSFNFKASYYSNISDTKSDEEMLKNEYLRNDEQGVRLSVNGTWRLNKSWISNLDYSASFQYSHQENIYNKYVGSGVVPYSHSYFPGEMQVGFLPTTYLCNYRIDGKPLYVSAQLKANKMIMTANGSSNWKVGMSYTLNANKGEGMVYDPEYPPTQGDGQSVRPRSYKSVPGMNMFSAFLESDNRYDIGSTALSLSAGVRVNHLFIDQSQALRGDITTVDPRINASFRFLSSENNSVFNSLSLVGGYGIASKMPTMSYLYPTPAYFDYSSYNSYAGQDDPRNIAVMTTAVVQNTANPALKPARSHKYEIGLAGRIKGMNFTVTFFKDRITNEFGFMSVPLGTGYNRYYIPKADYAYTTIPSYSDGALSYTLTDGTTKKAPFIHQAEVTSYSTPANTTQSDKHGIEYSINLGKIKALATDVIVDGAWFWIKRRSTTNSLRSSRVVTGINDNGISLYNTYLAVMPEGSGSIQSRVNTNFRLVTHIPIVKLVFTTTVQVVWSEHYRNIYEDADGNPLYHITQSTYGSDMVEVSPIGYYDKELNYHSWDPNAVERPDDLIFSLSNPYYFTTQKYPMTCMLNFKLTKEIRNCIQLSFIANNFLKFSNVYRQQQIGGYKELYSPLYFGAEIKIRI